MKISTPLALCDYNIWLKPSLKPSYLPAEDLVVCRDSKARIVSRFSDWIWDFRVYVKSTKATGKINFNREIYRSNLGLLLDVKHLLWIAINTHQSNTGEYAISSYIRWHSVLLSMSTYCIEKAIPLETILSSKDIFNDFLRFKCHKTQTANAITLLRILHSVNRNITGCLIVEPFLQDHRSNEEDDFYQTLVIPSRILFHCINKVKNSVQEFVSHAEQLENVVLLLASPRSTEDFRKSIESNSLSKLAEDHNIKNANNLSTYLSMIQFCSKTMIHIYSGMRRDEGYSLLPSCFRKEVIDDDEGYWIHGITTKIAGYRKKTAWVTSFEIAPAIQAAEKIYSWINLLCSLPSDAPLFSNTSHFPFSISHKRTIADHNDHKLANLTHHRFNHIFNGPDFIITNEDYEEIRFIEYSRNWEQEKRFIPGNFWHFTSHQFRRSLAYYGVDSGLISYSALHSQFKHIRMQMTVHYTKGGAAANSFFEGASIHFKHEFSKTKSIVNGLDYVKNIQLSEERLYGGHGIHVEKNIKPSGKAEILRNRQITVKQVEAGLIAYKPRATGGCVSPTPCHRHLISPLSACTTCKDGAVIPSLLASATETYIRFMETLEPGSPEHIMTQLELNKAVTLGQKLNIAS